MKIKIKYFLYSPSNQSSKKDAKKIYCRIRCGKKVHVFSLKREVQVEHWDRKLGRVFDLVPGASSVNGYLDMVEQSIQVLCMHNPSILEFRKTFHRLLQEKVARRQTDFHEAFLNFLERKSLDYTLSTVRKWKSLLGLLEKFVSASGGTLTFPGMHASFLTSFRSYLFHVCDQSDYTVTTYFRMLGSFLEWAGKHGFMSVIPRQEFRGLFHTASAVCSELTWLNEEDMSRLQEFIRSGATDPEAVLLLTVCFTGIRSDEIRLLNKDSLSDGVLHVLGKRKRNIYLSENEKDTVQLFLTFLANGYYGCPYQAKLNEMLRNAALKVGLQRNVTQVLHKQGEAQVREFPIWKLVTMDTARRTFLNRLKQKNLPIGKLLEMSGCKAPSALARYF